MILCNFTGGGRIGYNQLIEIVWRREQMDYILTEEDRRMLAQCRENGIGKVVSQELLDLYRVKREETVTISTSYGPCKASFYWPRGGPQAAPAVCKRPRRRVRQGETPAGHRIFAQHQQQAGLHRDGRGLHPRAGAALSGPDLPDLRGHLLRAGTQRRMEH